MRRTRRCEAVADYSAAEGGLGALKGKPSSRLCGGTTRSRNHGSGSGLITLLLSISPRRHECRRQRHQRGVWQFGDGAASQGTTQSTYRCRAMGWTGRTFPRRVAPLHMGAGHVEPARLTRLGDDSRRHPVDSLRSVSRLRPDGREDNALPPATPVTLGPPWRRVRPVRRPHAAARNVVHYRRRRMPFSNVSPYSPLSGSQPEPRGQIVSASSRRPWGQNGEA